MAPQVDAEELANRRRIFGHFRESQDARLQKYAALKPIYERLRPKVADEPEIEKVEEIWFFVKQDEHLVAAKQ